MKDHHMAGVRQAPVHILPAVQININFLQTEELSAKNGTKYVQVYHSRLRTGMAMEATCRLGKRQALVRHELSGIQVAVTNTIRGEEYCPGAEHQGLLMAADAKIVSELLLLVQNNWPSFVLLRIHCNTLHAD